jgi:hypothetical protein
MEFGTNGAWLVTNGDSFRLFSPFSQGSPAYGKGGTFLPLMEKHRYDEADSNFWIVER